MELHLLGKTAGISFPAGLDLHWVGNPSGFYLVGLDHPGFRMTVIVSEGFATHGSGQLL